MSRADGPCSVWPVGCPYLPINVYLCNRTNCSHLPQRSAVWRGYLAAGLIRKPAAMSVLRLAGCLSSHIKKVTLVTACAHQADASTLGLSAQRALRSCAADRLEFIDRG